MEMGKNTKTNKKATPKATTKNTNKEAKKTDSVKLKKNEEVKSVKPKKTEVTNSTKNSTKKNNIKKETPQTKIEKKEPKKELKPKIKEEKSDLKKLLILILIIAVLFLIFYFAVTFINNKKLKNIFPNDESLGSAEIDYNQVIVGNMLKQNQEEYYVLASKVDEGESDPYYQTLTDYRSYNPEYKIYNLDLNDIFNAKYVKEESNFDDEIAFSKTTLIKVKDGEIDEVYEDDDEIEEKLQNLLDEASKDSE